MSDIQVGKSGPGSTHVIKMAKIGDDDYYLKFSNDYLFDESDPSLQILVEYLAYKIYSLYPNVSIPQVHLVFDREKQRVGLASSSVKGKMALGRVNPEKLAKMLSAGILVDVLLANWDVIGTDAGNIVSDKEVATRIDPGGALTFRAQGGRKGAKFSEKPGELKTMLDPSFGGSGRIYSYADMEDAKKEFLAVPWASIAKKISETDAEITNELSKTPTFKGLVTGWKDDVSEIASKLAKRHAAIKKEITSSTSR